MKCSLTDLVIEPPGQPRPVVVDVEYKTDDQSLEIDFSDRDGRPGVAISFSIVNDILTAEVRYGAWVGKSDQIIQLIDLS